MDDGHHGVMVHGEVVMYLQVNSQDHEQGHVQTQAH